ncbi:MAG: hypothetical protein Q7S99_03065 [Parvibaculum sp.]|nr:hypothetical protein [Parvibaculum sp.]
MKTDFDSKLDAQLDARDKRRCKADDRAYEKLERQFDDAEQMIGELCREGAAVFYVCPTPRIYREAPDRLSLTSYLIRNRYV